MNFMNEQFRYESRCHYLLAFTGGFLGVYALVTRCDVFGSAQTANLIYLVTAVIGHDFSAVLQRVGAVLVYMSAIALAVFLPKHSKVNLPLTSVAVTSAVAALMGFLPETVPPVIALYPVFFATAFQWTTFKGAGNFNSSTIFSTNNLKQFTMALTEVLLNKDPSHKQKAVFYGCTLLSFHSGVAVSFLLCLSFGIHASLFALIPAGLTGIYILSNSPAPDRDGLSTPAIF